jgi:hypothetical protein
MRKALICWGGSLSHEPEQCATLFRDVLENEGFEVSVETNMDCYTDEKFMESLHLIVPIWSMASIEKDQLQALSITVMDGCGLAGWHGGLCDSFRGEVDYEFLTGANLVQHPGGIVDYEVNITQHDHPIMEGLSDFTMHSEQYFMHINPANNVLATTTFSGDYAGFYWIKGVVMPVVFTKVWGEGKIFYASYGHHVSDFDVPEAKEIVRRGMLWAAKSEEND